MTHKAFNLGLLGWSGFFFCMLQGVGELPDTQPFTVWDAFVATLVAMGFYYFGFFSGLAFRKEPEEGEADSLS